MGGLGSLLYSRVHSADVTGVLVIALFLGDRDLIEEIAAAGTLNHGGAAARRHDESRQLSARTMALAAFCKPGGVKRRRRSSWGTDRPIA